MPAQPHIAILDAGPGGYVSAIRAAQLGARVSDIEAQALEDQAIHQLKKKAG